MRPYYFLGNGRGLTRLSTGEVFFVDTDAHDISTWILLGGVWETFVDDILCALIRPGDTFLDIGANQGYYSVKMGARVGEDGRVFSFEPNPRMWRIASDNMRINGFDDRSVVTNAAAGAEAGKSSLTFDHNYPGGGMVGLSEAQTQPTQARIDIDVVRIDDVAPKDRPVDLIKIDVEGFEPLVLKGMRATLQRSPDAAIVTEVNYRQWQAYGDPATLLMGLAGDRRVFRIFTDGQIEELVTDFDSALNSIAVSYFLLLPKTEARWNQVRRFERGYVAPVNAPVAQGAPPPPPRRDLLSRIRRRLAMTITPDRV